jgi:hypothetical protein
MQNEFFRVEYGGAENTYQDIMASYGHVMEAIEHLTNAAANCVDLQGLAKDAWDRVHQLSQTTADKHATVANAMGSNMATGPEAFRATDVTNSGLFG